MPDVIAELLVALEHAELGPMTITYETGQRDLDAEVAARNGKGGPLDGDDLRTARCAALRWLPVVRGWRAGAGLVVRAALVLLRGAYCRIEGRE